MNLVIVRSLLKLLGLFSVTAALDDGECDAKQQELKWNPSAQNHECNIKRITESELITRFGPLGLPNLYPYPLVIVPDNAGSRHATRNEHFATLTTQERLPLNFAPDFNVTLTGSDSLSSHRRTISLKQYLYEIQHNNGGETPPDQLGNQTWYLFGETFSGEWAKFLREYNLPLCHSCTELHYQQGLIALSFGVGNLGSGVQWHLHGPGL